MTTMAPLLEVTVQSEDPEHSCAATMEHHVLDAFAGFYTTERQALQMLLLLGRSAGVQPGHLTLLPPADSGRLRFALRARRLNQHPHVHESPSAAPLWMAAFAGAVIAVAAADGALFMQWLVPVDSEWLTLALAALSGALLAVMAVAVLHRQQPQYRPFDRALQRQLRAGHWGLLVHGLPWKHQANVVALIRKYSLCWCAVTSNGPAS